MKLSKNLPLHEVIRSNTALRHNINNTPPQDHINNLKYLAQTVFQPIRDHFGKPIFVSSGYRSKALNKAIKGSNRSFHSYGMALDLDQDYRNTNIVNAQVFYYIKNTLQFTELIWEFGDDNNPNWVHVAIARGREDEKKIKIAYKDDKNKTKYKPWDRD